MLLPRLLPSSRASLFSSRSAFQWRPPALSRLPEAARASFSSAPSLLQSGRVAVEGQGHRKRRRTVHKVEGLSVDEEKKRRRLQLEIAQANTAFKPAGRYLAANQPDEALEACYKALEHLGARNPIASHMYENAIGVFLRDDHFIQAIDLYVHMNEQGYIPSLLLRAKMKSVSMAAEFSDEAEMTDGIRHLIADKSFNDEALYQFIRFLGMNMHTSPNTIDDIVLAYVDSQPGRQLSERTLKEMVEIRNTRDMSNRLEWQLGVKKHLLSHEQKSAEESETPGAGPYNAIMRDLPLSDFSTFQSVLDWMTAAGVKPDMETYNMLIFVQAQRGRYDKVFALYRLLQERSKEDPQAIPNGKAFRALFMTRELCRRAFEKSKQMERTFQRRAVKMPADPASLPSARELFHDMIEAHLRKTGGRASAQSDVIPLGVLHSALREFVRARDFAGAFVTVRTFTTCKILPNFHTYRTIILGLVSEIEAIIRDPEADPRDRAWVDALLAPALEELRGARVQSHALLAKVLLHFGREVRLQPELLTPAVEEQYPDDDPAAVHEISERGVVPSVSMLLGDEDPPVADLWDVRPLERVLRRAVAATVQPDGITGSLAAATSASIQSAKMEMIPSAGEVETNGEGHSDNRKFREHRFRKIAA